MYACVCARVCVHACVRECVYMDVSMYVSPERRLRRGGPGRRPSPRRQAVRVVAPPGGYGRSGRPDFDEAVRVGRGAGWTECRREAGRLRAPPGAAAEAEAEPRADAAGAAGIRRQGCSRRAGAFCPGQGDACPALAGPGHELVRLPLRRRGGVGGALARRGGGGGGIGCRSGVGPAQGRQGTLRHGPQESTAPRPTAVQDSDGRAGATRRRGRGGGPARLGAGTAGWRAGGGAGLQAGRGRAGARLQARGPRRQGPVGRPA